MGSGLTEGIPDGRVQSEVVELRWWDRREGEFGGFFSVKLRAGARSCSVDGDVVVSGAGGMLVGELAESRLSSLRGMMGGT